MRGKLQHVLTTRRNLTLAALAALAMVAMAVAFRRPAAPARAESSRRSLVAPSAVPEHLASVSPRIARPTAGVAAPRASASPVASLADALRASDADVRTWLEQSSAEPAECQDLMQFCQLAPARARPVVLEYARTLPEGKKREQLFCLILGRWAGQDPVAAAGWLDGQPDSPSEQAAWASLAAQWAEVDPARTAQIVAQLPPGTARDAATISVVAGWARREPTLVANWIAQFPETDLRAAAMEQLLFVWAARDAPAAARWIAQLPPGPSRAAALQTFRLRRPGS